MAQALWLVLGYAQRNHVPDPKGRRKGRGTFDDFLNAFNEVKSGGGE